MRRIFSVAIIYIAFCYFSHAQTVSPEILNRASEFGVNLTAINQTAILDKFNEVKKLVKEKCERNGGSEAFDTAWGAKDDLISCLQGLVNFTALNKEVEDAKPTGDLDIVFKKYCDKKPILERCVANFSEKLNPCMEPIEKDNDVIVRDALHSVLDFICHKEGDRIALFVGSGGKECFEERGSGVGKCLNATYGHYIKFNKTKPELPSITSLPVFLFNHKQCSDAATAQSCIVTELEKCDDPTPGNLMDSLMTFVRRQTPCERILEEAQHDDPAALQRSAGTAIIPSIFLTLSAFVLRLL